MSDELNPYPGNFKHHKVDAPAEREPLLKGNIIPIALRAPEEINAMHEAARAKDGEEIAKWKGIVKGVHGALNDIGTVPVPPLDADLYDAVMSIRAKDAELIQALVDQVEACRVELCSAIPHLPRIGVKLATAREAECRSVLEAAAAAGFKPSEQ